MTWETWRKTKKVINTQARVNLFVLGGGGEEISLTAATRTPSGKVLCVMCGGVSR